MATSIGLEAILIQEPLTQASIAKINRALAKWAVAVLGRLNKYPQQKPTTYRRTGRLGKGWTWRVTSRATDLAVEVGNSVFYAKFVQGFKSEDPKQTKVMADRDWPSAETVAQEEWKKVRNDIERALQG